MLTDQQRKVIVTAANLAPSVHNTQPARWRFDPDGAVTILADRLRFLAVGDPQGQDAALSCGAAIEGTVMALASQGLRGEVTEDLWMQPSNADGPCPVARIEIRGDTRPDPLAEHVPHRFTWRGTFLPPGDEILRALQQWAATRDDITVVHDVQAREMLADLNDEASLRAYRNPAYRKELVSWMRLSPRHSDYHRDGLGLKALDISRIEGMGAQVTLGTPLYGLLDRLGISGPLLSEKAKTMSAAAIALVHMPVDQSPVVTGRQFYRAWLDLTRLGLAAWPMAVLADDSQASQQCRKRFAIPAERRFVMALRLGAAGGTVPRARLPAETLIVDSM